MNDPLDVARFRLSAAKDAVNMRVQLMNAVASYNEKVVDIAKKWLEVEADREQLESLRTAKREFQRALKRSKQRRRDVERELERVSRFAANAARLELGEFIDPALLNSAWSGVFALIRYMTGPGRRAAISLAATSEHRLGQNFINPRHPGRSIGNAPSRCKTIISLCGWSRRTHVIPVSGSTAQALLFQMIDAMDAAFQSEVTFLYEKLTSLQLQTQQLQAANWKSLNVADYTPQ